MSERVKVTSDGRRDNRVYIDGEDVSHSVRSAQIYLLPVGAEVTLECAVDAIEVVGEDVRWVGLERVPREALEAELAERDEQGERDAEGSG